MKSVLGFELDEAVRQLREAGFVVITAPCDTKGTREADSLRVVRQLQYDDKSVQLLYGSFKTKV